MIPITSAMLRNSAGRSASIVLSALAAFYFSACENGETPTRPSPNIQANIPDEPAPSSIRIALSGVVHEQPPIEEAPIEGVTVEVIGGDLVGRSTITDAQGRFSFDGAPPPAATLKFAKPGYEERRQDVAAAPNQAPATHVVDIALPALPPIARLDIRIDNSGSKNAILGHSPIRFDASSSQAVRPTYNLEFGDGASTTESVAIHPCARSGLLTGRVTVTDAFGRAATATSQLRCLGLVHQQGRQYSLTYGWLNSDPDLGLKAGNIFPRRMAFEAQAGSNVSGFYSDARGVRTHFTGRLIGDRTIHIVLDDGSVEFSGEVLLNDIAHDSGYFVERFLKLIVNGGRDDGRRLDFEFYDPF